MARLFLTPVISQQSLFSLFEAIKSVDNPIPNDVIINQDDRLYYRLHGVPVMFKSEYSEAELTALAEELKNFNGQRYVFFNNTFGIAGIKNALFLNKLLNN